ncbi:MAG: DUF2330 domain-containing protein [Bdellovibrionales bacterium]|nr:DUF2330 domain-containing protein [Bdellovibrionales bacterium]
MNTTKKIMPCLIFVLMAFIQTPHAHAFCGFYVAKADAKLFNKASQVVYTRHENKTVISMSNDYEGDLKEFAMVIPVPSVLQRSQINVGERALFEKIDAYSAPRLVEYFDPDPCYQPNYLETQSASRRQTVMAKGAVDDRQASSFGVHIEAQYTVGEYDILILSAKESDGLETWLKQNGYKLPKGASKALRPYINQKLKFFVAKVNLEEQSKSGLSFLRPLQIAFESEKFMLPIRLGTINAKGPQDLLIYILTRNGLLESTNYRTIKMPSNMDIPVYVKDDFGTFYKDMFSYQTQKENQRVIFTEYVWNMGWCDPCAADPLSREELRKLGVFWLSDNPNTRTPNGSRKMIPRFGGAVPVTVTRLHVRYTKETFPEDLFFQETQDNQNFQGRYVLRYPWKGSANQCPQAAQYFSHLKNRQENEAKNLASLTGWDLHDIREKSGMNDPNTYKEPTWWERLWQ